MKQLYKHFLFLVLVGHLGAAATSPEEATGSTAAKEVKKVHVNLLSGGELKRIDFWYGMTIRDLRIPIGTVVQGGEIPHPSVSLNPIIPNPDGDTFLTWVNNDFRTSCIVQRRAVLSTSNLTDLTSEDLLSIVDFIRECENYGLKPWIVPYDNPEDFEVRFRETFPNAQQRTSFRLVKKNPGEYFVINTFFEGIIDLVVCNFPNRDHPFTDLVVENYFNLSIINYIEIVKKEQEVTVSCEYFLDLDEGRRVLPISQWQPLCKEFLGDFIKRCQEEGLPVITMKASNFEEFKLELAERFPDHYPPRRPELFHFIPAGPGEYFVVKNTTSKEILVFTSSTLDPNYYVRLNGMDQKRLEVTFPKVE